LLLLSPLRRFVFINDAFGCRPLLLLALLRRRRLLPRYLRRALAELYPCRLGWSLRFMCFADNLLLPTAALAYSKLCVASAGRVRCRCNEREVRMRIVAGEGCAAK
jgi:hypothetical protein